MLNVTTYHIKFDLQRNVFLVLFLPEFSLFDLCIVICLEYVRKNMEAIKENKKGFQHFIQPIIKRRQRPRGNIALPRTGTYPSLACVVVQYLIRLWNVTGFCEFRSLCVKKYTDRAVKTTRDSMFSNQAAIMEIQRIYFTLVVTQILEYSYCQK